MRAMVRVFDVHLEGREFVEREEGMKGFVDEDDGDESGEAFLREASDENDEEAEIEGDAEYQVSEVGKPWTTRNVDQTMHEQRRLSLALVERDDFKDETCTENLWPIAACAATFAWTELRAGNKRGCWIWYVFP